MKHWYADKYVYIFICLIFGVDLTAKYVANSKIINNFNIFLSISLFITMSRNKSDIIEHISNEIYLGKKLSNKVLLQD